MPAVTLTDSDFIEYDASNPLPVTPIAGGTPQDVNLTKVAGTTVVAATAPVPVGFYNPTGGALLDPSLPAEIVGNVAAAATDTGNPVKVGGVYQASPPTYTDGQRGSARIDDRGNIRARLIARQLAGSDGVLNSQIGQASEEAGTGISLLGTSRWGYNGTTWDRVRMNTAANGGAALVEVGPYTRGRVTADGQIKSSAGFIHTVSIAPLIATPTAGLLTIYDNTVESGTVVYAEWVFATTPGHTVTLDIPCGTGIYVGFDGTLANVQVTVAYR